MPDVIDRKAIRQPAWQEPFRQGSRGELYTNLDVNGESQGAGRNGMVIVDQYMPFSD
jgi:hypothetical protein